jgi:Ca2+-binding EF-hand superfamily protein
MGNNKSKEATMKSSEITEFQNMTSFSPDILIKLYDHYKHFSALQTDDGVIDYDEFCVLLNRNNKIITRRIFDTIDTNKDGCINFREFVKFISCFINGSLDEQINLSFKLFSNQEKKFIEKDTMYSIVKDIVIAEEALRNFFTNDTIETIVENTFKLTGNCFNFEMYQELCRKNPEILSWLKVDLDKIKKVKFNESKQAKKAWCG